MKKKYSLLLGLILLGGIYNLWTLRPVNVVYVYANVGWPVRIMVDHLPWTDRDKIDWFLQRWVTLKKEYPLFGDTSILYYIIDIGDGFTNYQKSPHEDLMCFPKIKNIDNCVVKNYLLIVKDDPHTALRFYVPDSGIEYQVTSDNKVEIVPRSETSIK